MCCPQLSVLQVQAKASWIQLVGVVGMGKMQALVGVARVCGVWVASRHRLIHMFFF